MTASGIKSSEALDELESHLREEIEQRMRQGSDAQQAFEASVNDLGSANALNEEFKKLPGTILGAIWCLIRKFFPASSGERDQVGAFTPEAEHSLAFARREAPLLGHDFVGTEHVLLGLIQSDTGVVPRLLKELRLDRAAIRREICTLVNPGQPYDPALKMPYTPRTRKALVLAAKEARRMNYAHVSAAHVFLGLLLEGEGVAALVLKNLGVDAQNARRILVAQLQS